MHKQGSSNRNVAGDGASSTTEYGRRLDLHGCRARHARVCALDRLMAAMHATMPRRTVGELDRPILSSLL
jgi:hypothetical protein